MATGCPCCGGAPSRGVLCASCGEGLAIADGLVPGHVASRGPASDAIAWLVDAFGTPHPVTAARALVGRRPDADLVVLNASVSRDHAELVVHEGGWLVRDLGSRNGTTIEGSRVQARAPLLDRARVHFGDVAFRFIARPVVMPDRSARSIETGHAGAGPFRYSLSDGRVDLCLVGSNAVDEDAVGGALLHRGRDAATWAELSLPPLEFHLLRMLCARAIEDGASPSRACVSTKQLAKKLPFQSRYANEENVRQVVRRVRASLVEIGAGELVAAQPGRGYYVTWPVLAG